MINKLKKIILNQAKSDLTLDSTVFEQTSLIALHDLNIPQAFEKIIERLKTEKVNRATSLIHLSGITFGTDECVWLYEFRYLTENEVKDA